MKRLYIIVEGQTEESFVKELVMPYFLQHGIYAVNPVLIQTSDGHKGGFVNYIHLKNDILRLLNSQGQDVLVTTLVDFFRCPKLPHQKEIDALPSHHQMVEAMEKSIASDINDRRFIPYIQLHEFEGLLFSSSKAFETYFDEKVSKQIQSVIDSFENPEDINSGAETAPSKRLYRIIPDYDKVLHGNIMALEIGFESILRKCPRFHRWIDTLIQKCKE